MKKLAATLFMLILASPLFATPDPRVTLQTAALGYPYTAPFTVNVTFSEPVTGFGKAEVNIINAVINSITGHQASYTLTVTPVIPGPITIFVPSNVVKSLSTGSPNLVSNKLNMMAMNPILNPSANFDLTGWSLILPTLLGDVGGAISIDPTTLNGYPTLNTGYTNPPYFFTEGVTGAMSFFAPLHGATTINSVFPRSELSEILPGHSATWSLGTFTSNTLTASLLVTQVPPSKKIVIGKIQDKGTLDSSGIIMPKTTLVKLYYDLSPLDPNSNPCNGCVYARIRPTPAQDYYLKTVTLLNNTPLNKLFMYKITLLRNGTLTVKASNTSKNLTTSSSTTYNLNTSLDNTVGWGAQQLFFKAGVYVPDNGTSNVLGGADSFYSLQIKHTGCPMP